MRQNHNPSPAQRDMVEPDHGTITTLKETTVSSYGTDPRAHRVEAMRMSEPGVANLPGTRASGAHHAHTDGRVTEVTTTVVLVTHVTTGSLPASGVASHFHPTIGRPAPFARHSTTPIEFVLKHSADVPLAPLEGRHTPGTKSLSSPSESPGQIIRETVEKIIVHLREPANERAIEGLPPQREQPERGVHRADSPRTEPLSPDPNRPTERSDGREAPTIVNQAILNVLNDPRIEATRSLQQIISNELAPRQVMDRGGPTDDPSRLTQSVPELHQSVGDKIAQLREALQTALESATPRPSPDRGNDPTLASATGPFSTPEPPSRLSQGVTLLERESRDFNGPSAPQSSPLNTSVEPPQLGAPSAARFLGAEERSQGSSVTGSGDRSIHAEPNQAEKGSSLLDAIGKVASKLTSLETLQRLDRALETAVISVAAAATLGVLGGELVLKEITELGRELLRRLRESGLMKLVAEPEQASLQDLVQYLEEVFHDRGVETIEKPANMTADIIGVVTLQNGNPLEGITIDGGSLGTSCTDVNGEFRFSNVALDTGYALELTDARYMFSPSRVVGTVSALNYITVTATRA